MIEVKKLKIYNFKSFSGEHVLEFPEGIGLNYVYGVNNADEGLYANAAGKTTLFDAITWVLYGKSSRGLRGKDIINWGKKHCYVELFLEIDRETFVIKRSSKSSTVFINEEEHLNINKIIDLSYGEFLGSVFIGQFAQTFLDKKQSERVELFSNLLNIDRWDVYAESCKKLKSIVEFDYKQKQMELNGKKLALKSHLNRMDKFYEKKKQVSEKLEEELNKIKNNKLDIEEKLKEIKADIEQDVKNLNELNKELKELNEKIDDFNNRIAKYETTRREAQKNLIMANSYSQFIRSEYENFMKMAKTGICSICKSELEQEKVKETVKELKQKMKEAKGIRDRFYMNVNKSNTYIEKAEEKLNNFVEKRNELITIIDNLKEVLSKKRNKRDKLSMILKSINRELELKSQIMKEKFDDEEELLIQTKNDLEKDVNKLQNEANEQYEIKTIYEFWYEAFYQIKIKQIYESIDYLNIEIENIVNLMGLKGWDIKFKLNQDNIKRRSKYFDILIRSDKSENYVKWESWSGGETQRLRLAVMLGLFSLISMQHRKVFNILVLDEPTHHVDKEGITDLLNVFKEFSEQNNKQIWLIDHNTLDYGGFNNVYCVEKGINGSEIKKITTT